MKKTTLVLMNALLVLTLAACGSQNKDSEAVKTPEVNET